MKDVYVIKVKTKPPLSSLYPSERRYSSSTVGGLSLVHLGLSILAFLLGTLAKSLQGPVLSFACLVPFISGLLAWRRWYIDKNISFFFYGSLFSLVVSILCGLATAFDIATIKDNRILPTRTSWKIEEIFQYPDKLDAEKRFIRIIEQNETDEEIVKVIGDEIKQNCNDTILGINDPEGNISGNSSSPMNKDRYFTGFKNRIFSFWQGDASSTSRTSLFLDVNVLVTCVLEICWSLLSVKISLRGMQNRNIDTSYDNNGSSKSQRIKPRAPNPEFDDHIHSYDENLGNFNHGYRRNSITDNSGPRLPLPESNNEFRERVERFLANQAAHRIVEGSCS